MSAPKESIIFDILFHSSFSSNGEYIDFPICCGFAPEAVVVVTKDKDDSFTDLSSDVGVYGSRFTTKISSQM